jgi:hypothetical protein
MKNESNYKLERTVNAALAAMPPEHRPEMSSRRRVQSVAYQAAGYFQATDASGNVESIEAKVVAGWWR